MILNDKVQVGDTTGTSTSTTASQWQTYKAEQGWECPRCGRINAPWVRQCDCSGNNWTITSNWTCKPDEWWKTYVQADDITKNSNVYQVGGSDYKTENTYVNVSGTQSNKVDPNISAWSCTSKTDVPKTYTTVK